MYHHIEGTTSGEQQICECLCLVRGNKFVEFDGHSIEGYCDVGPVAYKTYDYKWEIDYFLNLAPRVKALNFSLSKNGELQLLKSDFGSWEKLGNALNLPLKTIQLIIRTKFKTAASQLDKQLDKFNLVEEINIDDQRAVSVEFGTPTTQETLDGFWSNPKGGLTKDGLLVTLGPGGPGFGWIKPIVTNPEGAKVLSSSYKAGPGGKWWTVRIQVPHC